MTTTQQTIKNSIWCKGIGLHSGIETQVQLCPGSLDTGIVFEIKSSDGTTGIVPVNAQAIKSGQYQTVLEFNNIRVATTEHLLAACSAYGISNLLIRVWGNEIPIHDGSANAWSFLLDSAGIQDQQKEQNIIRILKPLEIKDGNSWCKLIPYPYFEIDYTLDYDLPSIGKQQFSIRITRQNFLRELSRARTFGLLEDYEYLQKENLSKGANFSNTLVYTSKELVNAQLLAWNDEPVRHKVIDVIGDLALLGRPIIGKFIGYRSGHSLNLKLVKELEQNKNHWTMQSG